MKAEDTIKLCKPTSSGWRINCDAKCHRNQAEISFKAGQEDVVLESKMGTLTVSSLVNRGRKEVVEWVEKRLFDAGDEGYMQVSMGKSEWQAKLKEWGINEKT